MAKYFTLSFDDGLEQDKKIIDMLRGFGLNCATFNLNSGIFGTRQAIGRIGNFAFYERPVSGDELPKDGLLKYHRQFRVPADEVAQVYANVEVACHGLSHRPMVVLSKDEIRREITEDKVNLEKCFGKPVKGFVFPKGLASKTAHRVIQDAGFAYTRGAKSTRSYAVPADLLYLQPTVWQIDRDAETVLDRFLSDSTDADCLFYMWGHGYELDFGTEYASYERLKRMLDKVAGRDDIICCSNREAVEALSR